MMGLLFPKKDFEISTSGVSQVEKINVGGVEQYLLIQTENVNHPVLLIIHGGPGMPIPGVSCRSRDYVIATTTKELVKHYTVVFWDQRGAGKSFNSNIPQDSFHVSQFVEDAKEVVQILKKQFNKNKIYVAGHSWGTIIGLQLAFDSPTDIHAYIGISQVVNWVENDRLSLQWTLDQAKQRNNQKAINELTSCGEPPYIDSVKQWATLRKWMSKFNSMVYTDDHVKHPGMRLGMSLLLRSADYSLKDIMNTFKGMQVCYTQQLIEDFAALNFTETVPRIEIPVIFIHGRKDVHIYGELVETYYNSLEAPAGKQLLWMEKSSHMYHPDDARNIEKILISVGEANIVAN